MRNNQQSVNFTGTQNTMYVSTINDLRRYKPSQNGQVVLCSGSEYVGDGQGNFYSWSDTATGTDDGITIIQSQYSGQNGGRWLILNKQGNIDAVVASLNSETANRIAADNVLQTNINNETTRALAAETQITNAKVNRDGDVMYGALNITNNAGLHNTATYIHQSGQVEEAKGMNITVNGSTSMDVSMKQNDKGYYAAVVVNGTEYQIGDATVATGNRLIVASEVSTQFASGTIAGGYYTRVGNILTQTFSVQGDGVGTVTYPMAYPAGVVPIVQMSINAEPGTNTSRFANFLNTSSGANAPNIWNTGFVFQPVYTHNSAGTSTVPWTLQVTVTGSYS